MLSGTIKEVIEGEKLVHTFERFFEQELEPSLVTYQLYDRGAVVKLQLTHSGIKSQEVYDRQLGAWRIILNGLKSLLETGEPLGLMFEQA